MKIAGKIHRAFRGAIGPKVLALELLRRSRASFIRHRERAGLEHSRTESARLRPQFARMSSKELLAHFQGREQPQFFPGFSDTRSVVIMQLKIFPSQSPDLIISPHRIVCHHSWPLLGFGEKSFGAEIKWHQDPLSGVDWSSKYHKDIQLNRGDGSDARVLWELNRL